MIIDKSWRILTIGDGDLSFSNGLLNAFQPTSLTATVYDSQATLSKKYGDEFYQKLATLNIQTLCNFDVCEPKTWHGLVKNSFDLVIFQFPLLPAFNSLTEYQERCAQSNPNILNRHLLRQFLINSFEHFLDPNGQQLCYITSKDVKPYRQWNIENSLHLNTNIHYLGSTLFNIELFPGYKIRNVDRNKHVKNTKGITYVWGLDPNHQITKSLQSPQYIGDNYCRACRAGPFSNQTDATEHQTSRKHIQQIEYERLWLNHLDKQ